MQELKIDYSEVPNTQPPAQAEETWEAPPHKYFGPKDPKTGKMKPEPVYQHQEYPRTVYAKRGDTIAAKLVHSDAEFKALGQGWTKNLMDLGYIGAPSQEQLLEMRAKEAQKPAETDKTLHAKKAA